MNQPILNILGFNVKAYVSTICRSSGKLQGPDGFGPAHSPGRTQRATHRLQEGEGTPSLKPAALTPFIIFISKLAHRK